MTHVAVGWEMSVERGPGWLFVRPLGPPAEPEEAEHLASEVWALLEQNLMHRLVLELDQIGPLHSVLIGQLIWLQKRVHAHCGLLRICGLSPANEHVLEICRLGGHLPSFATRSQAVMGKR